MDVQPNAAVTVDQAPVRGAGDSKAQRLLSSIGLVAGTLLGTMAGDTTVNREGRKIFENKLLQPFLIKPEFAPVLGGISGYFVGEGIYHGLTAWAKESGAIKVCICIGGVCSMLAGRELMYSLVDINNPYPDSVLCRLTVGVNNEVFNDSALFALGVCTGYVAGKGIEYVAGKARAGIDMAASGVASLVTKARPDVEPDGGKKAS